MLASAEISYYPLVEDFITPIHNFIQQLTDKNITIEKGKMSTIITGEFIEIMNLLTQKMGDFMSSYPSVFIIKISNSCPEK